MGETGVIEKVLERVPWDAVPWLAPVLIVVLLMRKEIISLLFSGRNETAIEKLMLRMCGLFEKNLEYFGRVEGGVEDMCRNQQTIIEIVRDINRTQQREIEEMVRGRK